MIKNFSKELLWKAKIDWDENGYQYLMAGPVRIAARPYEHDFEYSEWDTAEKICMAHNQQVYELLYKIATREEL